MREIKLRAWDKDRKEYLSGGQVLIAIQPGVTPKNVCYLDIVKYPDEYKNRFIIEEFTEFEDVCGRDIYEGDIIKYLSEDIFFPVGIVEWSKAGFIVSWKKDSFMSNKNLRTDFYFWATQRRIKVIGNVHLEN